jgi:hypothetical protein
MFILEFASSIKSADEPFFNYRWQDTVAASDAGTQAACGRHGGRNELTNSRFIDEEYKAGIERRSVKDLNNIIEQDQQAIKRVICPLLGVKLFRAAQRAVAGIKVMEMTEKGAADERWWAQAGTSRTVLLASGIAIREVRLALSPPKTASEDLPHCPKSFIILLSLRSHGLFLNTRSQGWEQLSSPLSKSSLKTPPIAPPWALQGWLPGFPW